MSVERKQQLSDRQLSILESEMDKQKKSLGLAYAFLIIAGGFGIHKFYLGKVRWGIVYIALTILGLTGWYSGLATLVTNPSGSGAFGIIGIICILILGVLLLIDLFTLPKQVRTENEKAEERIIEQLLASTQSDTINLDEDK